MKKTIVVILIFCTNIIYSQEIIRNLQWFNGDSQVTELTLLNGVTLYAETENIDNNEIVKIAIWEKSEIKDHLVGEYISRVVNDKILFHWFLIFERDETEEESRNGFTVQYYFTVQYNSIIRRSSNLDILSSIRRRIQYEGTDYFLVNRKYTIILPDDTTIDGWTDEEGYIHLENIRIWGDTYFFMHDESSEENEIIPAYREPDKPVYYRVREGDDLYIIASRDYIYGNQNLWSLLFESNRHNFINNNDIYSIEIGQTIIIPPIENEIRRGTR